MADEKPKDYRDNFDIVISEEEASAPLSKGDFIEMAVLLHNRLNTLTFAMAVMGHEDAVYHEKLIEIMDMSADFSRRLDELAGNVGEAGHGE